MCFKLNKQPHYYPWLHLAFFKVMDWILTITGTVIGTALLCLFCIKGLPLSAQIVVTLVGAGWLLYAGIRTVLALFLRGKFDFIYSGIGVVSLETPLGVCLTHDQLSKTIDVITTLLKENAFPLVKFPEMRTRVLSALKGYSIVWVPRIDAQAYADTFTNGKKYNNTINGYTYGKETTIATEFTWARGYFSPMEQVLTTALVHELGHALIMENLIKTGGLTTDTWLNMHRFDDTGYQMHILERLRLL